jgi:hypothetical protein
MDGWIPIEGGGAGGGDRHIEDLAVKAAPSLEDHDLVGPGAPGQSGGIVPARALAEDLLPGADARLEVA